MERKLLFNFPVIWVPNKSALEIKPHFSNMYDYQYSIKSIM